MRSPWLFGRTSPLSACLGQTDPQRASASTALPTCPLPPIHPYHLLPTTHQEPCLIFSKPVKWQLDTPEPESPIPVWLELVESLYLVQWSCRLLNKVKMESL